MSFPVAVLVSGEGSNLQAILDQLHGRGEVEVVGVASNKATARGLQLFATRPATGHRGH